MTLIVLQDPQRHDPVHLRAELEAEHDQQALLAQEHGK